jgi:glycerol-3-phosphate acyltransferase PlsX
VRQTIAIDCMGADHGPLPLITGAVEYLRNPQNAGTSVVLVGDEPLIREHLKGLSVNGNLPISVVHASEVVDMHIAATEGLKKRDSSMAVAVRMHKEGLVDAVISAGNTGAVMANAVLTLGRLQGVSRPAIAAAMPNRLERWTLLLDVGANVDVRPDHILQFAKMGVSYAEDILKIQSPRVGLLSIGEESVKGNELTASSHELLAKGKAMTFVGNVEGRDILEGTCDVVVCDGFIGNIILKFAESMKGFLESRIHKQISSNPFSKAGAILMGPFLRRMRRVFDYSEYGGAPLLGINGNCVISHGKSSAKAINNAVKIAVEMVRTDAKAHIERRIAGNQQEIIGQ